MKLARAAAGRPGAVPLDALAARALPCVDYVDAYSGPVGADASVESVARALFLGRPLQLMRLRDAVVRPWGLKTSERQASGELRFVPGERIGLFTLYERTPEALLLGADDRHLDFRLCLFVPGDGQATLTTLVRFHNGWGRAYFFLIRPFHALVARALLRRAAPRPPT
ncbi:MAG: DUF2867 domain-containing protein [Myxococcaceae bacterium]